MKRWLICLIFNDLLLAESNSQQCANDQPFRFNVLILAVVWKYKENLEHVPSLRYFINLKRIYEGRDDDNDHRCYDQ